MTSIVARRGQSYLAATRRAPYRHASTIAPAPVTPAEFTEHLLRCTPPGGWRDSIAVANSGGPDSVCLLFLLSSVLRERKAKQSDTAGTFPVTVHSIHLNHGVQAANAQMESVAASQAKRFHVPHIKISIPWTTQSQSGKPKDQITEEYLRRARTALLYMAISKLPTRCLAYAHHADDQVETSIMRLSCGSKDWGASGMRPVRRWGMGESKDLYRPHLRGMQTWIVRPLLDIPKDRLIATCEANGLEYVVDPTNFQPDMTIRNAIRGYLHRREVALQTSPAINDILSIPQNWKERGFEDAIQNLCPGRSTLTHLRSAVSHLGKQLELHEVQATSALNRAVLPSPPSTILLSVDKLLGCTEPQTQTAIARRIMRYVSPQPWASLAAIGHARVASSQALVSLLWDNSRTLHSLRTFTSGGCVMWQAISLGRDGEIKYRLPEPHEPLLWLGQRAPPPAGKVYNLHFNVTERLQAALQRGQPKFTCCYDNRFSISIHLDARQYVKVKNMVWSLPEMLEKGKIIIRPKATLYLPEVVWERNGEEDCLLGYYRPTKKPRSLQWTGVPWVAAYFARPLSML
ncbi:hypothetical protein PHLGIDRAFT_331780 [Phlebiopsis gigantea 11061_1 CR5-6]|uniref:tRNA(Ile)-lysidine synthetase n=1 Tax=Phlebiopsis gigantea (strain 11061_1 CR5-6) TaxID=745531 RepID=A0A0C3SE31_PHLG1|nr:hypothetical protein PHLGIDRAFT_331780 [Phlebiopsis gigantea 11061_1 CR5-6]